MYNDIGLEKIKNIPLQDILTLRKNGGGYRDNQQITSLREDIIKNGIKNPNDTTNKNSMLESEKYSLPTKEWSD